MIPTSSGISMPQHSMGHAAREGMSDGKKPDDMNLI